MQYEYRHVFFRAGLLGHADPARAGRLLRELRRLDALEAAAKPREVEITTQTLEKMVGGLWKEVKPRGPSAETRQEQLRAVLRGEVILVRTRKEANALYAYFRQRFKTPVRTEKYGRRYKVWTERSK